MRSEDVKRFRDNFLATCIKFFWFGGKLFWWRANSFRSSFKPITLSSWFHFNWFGSWFFWRRRWFLRRRSRLLWRWSWLFNDFHWLRFLTRFLLNLFTF